MTALEITPGFLAAVAGLVGLTMIGLAVVLPAITGREQANRNHDGEAKRPGVGAYVLLAEPSGWFGHTFGARPGSVGIVVRHSQQGHDDTGVFVHWLTKPDDLVCQDLAALEAACIYGVRCELDELVYLESTPSVPAEQQPLTKEY
ncbi:hypothetical protein [Streptomyces sp. NBC_00439]|uniref:hypothetical protein n=1 Tax=Streptomyces sp. NBC_00439 TaxID=2903650 RepID=UPI002259861E|nr:hypothetical protein [Streptomyces sp. NBC_00439]MCX5103558.1 hypothetical protein [Streptomyces sp. NBC_00439]